MSPGDAVPAISHSDQGLLVGVRVIPSAPSTAVRGLYGERMKISVNAPPEDNRANIELVSALARWVRVRKGSVNVVSGHGSRDKVVAFAGIDEDDLRQRLVQLTVSKRDGKRSERHG